MSAAAGQPPIFSGPVERGRRAMEAMMKMVKIDIATIEQAAEEASPLTTS